MAGTWGYLVLLLVRGEELVECVLADAVGGEEDVGDGLVVVLDDLVVDQVLDGLVLVLGEEDDEALDLELVLLVQLDVLALLQEVLVDRLRRVEVIVALPVRLLLPLLVFLHLRLPLHVRYRRVPRPVLVLEVLHVVPLVPLIRERPRLHRLFFSYP